MLLPKCRCVYAINNIENGKMYIGSTINLRKRVYEHKSKLNSNYHRNKGLQKDFNKLGWDGFNVKIIKKVKNDNLKQREKEIIKKQKENNMYNKRYISNKNYKSKKYNGTRQISVYIEDEQYDRLQEEDNKSKAVRKALDMYYQNQKEENKMTRKELIEGMKGNSIIVDAGWLEENDPEMLEWLTGSEYWCKGFENMEINPEDAVLEMHFESRGVAYKATFKGHPDGIGQSLNNQPMWGDDNWEDWDDMEQLRKYYQKIKEEK